MIRQKFSFIGWMAVSLLSFSANVWSMEHHNQGVLESKYISESKVEHQSGELAINESKFSYEHEFKFKETLPVTFSIAAKDYAINSDVSVYLPSNLVGYSLGLGAKFPLPFSESPHLFMGIDVFPSIYTDGWEEHSWSAFRVPFRSYVIYKRDDQFIVFAGVSVRPNFDSSLLPIIGFIYKPNEQLEFRFASDNPTVSYQFTEKTKLFWEADLVNDEFEVTHLGETGRILSYREIGTGLGIEHRFCSSFKGSLSVGGVFARSIKYEDDTGKINPDAGMYVKARMTIDF